MEAFAIAVRWLNFLAASLLVGSFAFLVLVARPAARAAGPGATAELQGLDRRLVGFGSWMLAATAVASVLDLWRQTAVATGVGLAASLTPAAIGAVLLTTQYGTVWLVRLALLVLAGGLAALSLSLIGAAGHAASAQEGPVLAIAVDGVHLLATGVWFGGLVPLTLLLRRAERLPEPAATALAAAACRRFSILGLAAVAALVGTGVFNSW